VDADGRAALCDFGLSQFRTPASIRTSEDGTHVASRPNLKPYTGLTPTKPGGTLRYLAPEQMRCDDGPTLRTDVYAFACTCAEILTGQSPFASIENSDPRASSRISDLIYDGQPPYALELITINYPLFAFLADCWCPDPSGRPSSMLAVCDRMEAQR